MKPGETAPIASTSLDRQMLAQLDQLAADRGLRRADLVRAAIARYLDQQKGGST